MNLRERINEAYKNVLLTGDSTWTNYSNDYQKMNLKLAQAAQQLQLTELKKFCPRTVHDSIPQSRLAQYSNYSYDEARELSYTPSVLYFPCRQFKKLMMRELWELPEVEDLFEILLNPPNEDDYDEIESPLLNVNSLEEKILKVRISAVQIKRIWGQNPNNKAVVTLNCYKSPFGNYFVTAENSNERSQPSSDFEQLKKLSNYFKEQNEQISKSFTQNDDECKTSKDVLYSEVLQGLTINRKLHLFTTANYPVLTSCVQQTYFYSAQTSSYHQNFTMSRQLQSKPFAKQWLAQNQVNFKTVNPPQTVIDVTKNISEELETQALEQYNNSNEEIYKELEEEAKKQYDCS